MAKSPELMIFVDVKSIEYVRQPAIRLVLPSQPCIGFIYTIRHTGTRAVSVAAAQAIFVAHRGVPRHEREQLDGNVAGSCAMKKAPSICDVQRRFGVDESVSAI